MNMGQFIDNYQIREQDLIIEQLQNELEEIKKIIEIKEFQFRENLLKINYHIQELLKLKEKQRLILK